MVDDIDVTIGVDGGEEVPAGRPHLRNERCDHRGRGLRSGAGSVPAAARRRSR